MSTQTYINTESTTKINPPKKYKVIIHNDDYTPMDFVVSLLMNLFKHDFEAAEKLTMAIHKSGSAIAGVYFFEIAEEKCYTGVKLARKHGYPLILSAEKE